MVDPDSESALAAARSGVDGCVRIDDPRGIARVVGHRVALLRRLADQTLELRRVSDIHQRYNLLLESSSEAIAYLHEGLHIYANPSYLDLFGYESFQEVEGFSILDLLRSDGGATDLKQLLKSLARGDLPEEALTLQAVRAEGETFKASAEFAPAHYDGEPCTQIMVRKQIEAGDSAELQQELEKLRSHDLLTGLLNRQAFIRHLQGELEQPPAERHMAVVLATLDNHAALQSRVGAAATDLLIRQAAEIFGEVIGEDLLPSRLSDHVLAARVWFGERQDAEASAWHSAAASNSAPTNCWRRPRPHCAKPNAPAGTATCGTDRPAPRETRTASSGRTSFVTHSTTRNSGWSACRSRAWRTTNF